MVHIIAPIVFLLHIATTTTVCAAPCVPEDGKTSLVIGQDLYAIANYTDAVKQNRNPFGLMSYTALSNEHGTLAGLKDPINYGAGIQWASGLSQLYPNASIQLGLYMVGDCVDIAAGNLDYAINELVAYVVSKPSTSFYIRIGYEFDFPDNGYVPTEYIAAYQHIVDMFKQTGVRDANENSVHSIENVAFVWHSTGVKLSDASLNYDDWYPGDNYVDWCGVSIFKQPYDCQNAENCNMKHLEHFASYCGETLKKPLMIAESTPFGGIVDEEADENTHNEAGYVGGTWNRWFEPVLSFIDRFDVKMWCYINCDWDALPMFSLKSSTAKTATSVVTTPESSHNSVAVVTSLVAPEIETSKEGSKSGDDASDSSSHTDESDGVGAKERERRQVEVPVEHWGDSRVQEYQHVYANWKTQILKSDRYLISSEDNAICDHKYVPGANGDDKNIDIDDDIVHREENYNFLRHNVRYLWSFLFAKVVVGGIVLYAAYTVGMRLWCHLINFRQPYTLIQ